MELLLTGGFPDQMLVLHATPGDILYELLLIYVLEGHMQTHIFQSAYVAVRADL